MALCPICEQPLPETPVSRCPSCGADVAAAVPPEPYLPPPPAWPPAPAPDGRTPEAPERDGETPWDERGRIGFFSALVETTRQVLTGPTAFFRAMPVEGGIGSPILYGVIIGWVGAVAASFYQALFHSIVGVSLFEALTRLANPNAVPSGSPLSGWLEGWGGLRGAGRLRRRPGRDRRDPQRGRAASGAAAARRRPAWLRSDRAGRVLLPGRQHPVPRCRSAGSWPARSGSWCSTSSASPRRTGSDTARPSGRCCCPWCSSAAAVAWCSAWCSWVPLGLARHDAIGRDLPALRGGRSSSARSDLRGDRRRSRGSRCRCSIWTGCP